MTSFHAERAFTLPRDDSNGRSTLRLTLAVVVPVLAVAMSLGVVDACAYAQHSLLKVYSISSSVA